MSLPETESGLAEDIKKGELREKEMIFASQGRGEVETKTVHMHLIHPVA